MLILFLQLLVNVGSDSFILSSWMLVLVQIQLKQKYYEPQSWPDRV